MFVNKPIESTTSTFYHQNSVYIMAPHHDALFFWGFSLTWPNELKHNFGHLLD